MPESAIKNIMKQYNCDRKKAEEIYAKIKNKEKGKKK